MKVTLKIDKQYEEPHITIETATMTPQIEEMIRCCEGSEKVPVFGSDSDKLIPIKPEKVIRFFSLDKKIYCELVDRIVVVKVPLYQLETSFKNVIRISNSELINPDYIEELELSFSGTIKINLRNGSETYSSRRYMKELKRRLGL